jgi:hypothetical protein
MNIFSTRKDFKIEFFIIAFLFLAFSSGIAYAYWDAVIREDDPIIDIGVGTIILVSETLQPSNELKLVPVGAFRGSNDVNEVLYRYAVTLNKEGQLTVTVKNILVNGVTNPFGLIHVDVYLEQPNDIPQSSLNIVFEDDPNSELFRATVLVRVTLSLPENEEQYLSVRNGTIEFTLECKAEELPE